MTRDDYGRSDQVISGLASIVESFDDAVMAVSLEGTIVAWNQGAERLYGHARPEMVGRPLSVVVAPEHRQQLELALRRVANGQATREHAAEHIAKHDVRIHVTLTLSPVRDGDEIVAASLVLRDATEQRWIAATLDAALRNLELRPGQDTGPPGGVRQFVTDAAHQLRSPIAAIQTCAESLLKGTSQHDRDRLLAGLLRETTRATRVMNAILRMARIDVGERLSPEPSDLGGLCAEEVDRTWVLAPHLQVEMDMQGLLDHQPEVDAGAMREILSNLLDNARRHALSRIHVVVRAVGQQLEVRVSDDGTGLAADVVERAFERFATLDGMGGTGLGLPIARGLARAHGGDLTYEEAAFVVRLPLRPK